MFLKKKPIFFYKNQLFFKKYSTNLFAFYKKV